MFYNQPLATRFGTELLQQVDPTIAPHWDSLDIAVAWVRASGMAHLNDRFRFFLENGGRLSIIVGIDLKNTTREGLQALLDLEPFGRCETYVYHNESGSIFHPKLYLFRNQLEARLIVGSNNLTQAGLYVNVEAGLQVDARVADQVVIQALDALATWKDTSTQLALRLDAALLDRLVTDGYIIDETAARAIMRQDKARLTSRRGQPVFGRKNFSAPVIVRPTTIAPAQTRPSTRAPRIKGIKQPPAPANAVSASRTPLPGDTVLMRLRMARGTQTQIPIRLTDTFFATARTVRSSATGEEHEIRLATAQGRPNTMKLELPETRTFRQPMARFERTAQGIVYEVYDLGTPQGNQIMASLVDGQRDSATQMSISNAERATWWRFI